NVDAIIGAASSSVSLSVIDKITGAGVLQISPANTSDELTNYADKGLYFRTAPPDVLQGRVLGDLILADGNSTVGILALQDSYDATILVALAAQAAGDDSGASIASKMQEVSAGGEKCTSFKDCVALIKAGKDIDYDGVSGPIEFNAKGDPSEATIGIYQYGADNKYTF